MKNVRTNKIISNWKEGKKDLVEKDHLDIYDQSTINRAIRWSVMMGDAKLFDILLDRSDQKKDMTQSFFTACKYGQYKIYKHLIDIDKRINKGKIFKETAHNCLRLATKNNCVDIIEKILKANTFSAYFVGQAVTSACIKGRKDALVYLVKYGERKYPTKFWGEMDRAYKLLLKFGHIDAIKQINDEDIYNYTPFESDYINCCVFLANRGSNKLFDVIEYGQLDIKKNWMSLSASRDRLIKKGHIQLLAKLFFKYPQLQEQQFDALGYDKKEMKTIQTAISIFQNKIILDNIKNDISIDLKRKQKIKKM